MKRRNNGQHQRSLKSKDKGSRRMQTFNVRYVPVPNTDNAVARLSRAIAILLKATDRSRGNEH